MRLPGQLLALSAVTLLLPWAGCQYAREIEEALRAGQQEAVLSSARLLAAALAPVADELASEPARWSPSRPWGLDFYAHRLDGAPVLDGFVEDWGALAEAVDPLGGREILVGLHGGFVYLFVGTEGPSRPGGLAVIGAAGRLEFPLDAPGGVVPRARPGPADPRSRGNWQATSSGWQLEARIPLEFFRGRLGIDLLALDGTAIWSSYRQSPGWITGPSAAAQSALVALAPPWLRVYVTDRDGFVLARHGTGGRGPEERSPTGLLPALLRPALGAGVHADPPPESRPGQLSGRHLELAALGHPDARWYASPAGGGLVAAAAPVPGRDGPAALVVAERDTAAILSLTRGPTRRLVLTSLLLSLGAAAVLFGHAAWLSWRIRRLRDAAEAAVGDRGEVAPVLPGASARDEIGDLARSFGGLLGRVRDYNLYLQGLGGKLAHELRTPLAMVQSSLDNLDAEDGRPGPWLDRARLGVERMSRLVTALAAARRIEAAMAAAGRERFDLAGQLEDMVAGWREIHDSHAFALERPAGPCLAEGAPDLLAQALDKLVENAVDFTPPGGRIAVGLGREADRWRISVANPGSRLPPGPPARLFDSLVSRREDAASAHLGLGLYIVRLVAEGHGGRASARNLPGDEGVEFVLELPAVPEGERFGTQGQGS